MYSPDSLGQLLDRALRLDLAVVVDIPLPAYDDKATAPTLTPLTDSILALVDRHRDHPALLFWMLGNEIFQNGYDAGFLQQYNQLADAVRALDADHPVSTAVIPHQLLSLYTGWAGLRIDFISLNMFGNLSTFDRTRDLLTPVWRGPYLISEWSFNGPWEEQTTLWGAPLESPSTTKAQHLRDRYLGEVSRSADRRLLGNLAFYWGAKYERTPTWFSLLSATGGSSEPAFALGNLWQERSAPFPGPQVAYLLLDERGGQESIMLPAGTSAMAKVQYAGLPPSELTFKWEVRAEDWRGQGELGFGPDPIAGLFLRCDRDSTSFRTPDQPGPYRIYYYAESSDGFFSTANIPFYVVASNETK
ncbi:glycoside hydrolase family 2 TIM barrel-domain containing protein [Neolewinella sp.]|uniref:glycoside hydrolase family 2 TIM barrel-domain containing protein n=1 Tax=Neolewinella sp. TaxID=2993543 RepID=UPI003B5244AF